ncbi:hypothetical protein QBC44DRAFT_365475 [Cladorrhinum sp. PSN332]|nr:hypothetical protein QBC44DRAFT_365475 [Cladorrhinum sp. PSN332]
MCFGTKPKSNSPNGRPYPPMARPQQIPLNTQAGLSQRPPIPPTLTPRAKYFNPDIRPSKAAKGEVPVRPAVPHAPIALNAPHYKPSTRPSRAASSVPAGMPLRQAAYREPPTPYLPAKGPQKKQPKQQQPKQQSSLGPALPSTFTTFNPARKAVTIAPPARIAATQTAIIEGRARPKPPPLVMSKAGIMFQSPYTLTQKESKAGLSPQPTMASSWTGRHVSVSPV